MQRTPRRMFFWTWLLPIVPLVTGIAAAILFRLQGGFGGGHGRYDQAIAYLGLPGTWIMEQISWEDLTRFSDFQLVVLFPCAINMSLALLVGGTIDVVWVAVRYVVRLTAK